MGVVLPFPTRRVRASRRFRPGLFTRETAILAAAIALLLALLVSVELHVRAQAIHLPVTGSPARPGGHAPSMTPGELRWSASRPSVCCPPSITP
jgi:hypothetical protein